MIRVLPLAAHPEFRSIGTMPPLDPATEEKVDAIWRRSGADPDWRREDNPILGVSRYGAGGVEAFKFSYRYYLAQVVEPGLFPTPFNALAVSGLLTCEGQLVFGRRAPWVTQDPGVLEFAPAGSVEARFVDADGSIRLDEQFDHELEEELGVAPSAVRNRRKVGLAHDLEAHVVDIVIAAELRCGWVELVEAHARLAEPEYTELVAYRAEQIAEMTAAGQDSPSPTAAAIFTGLFGAVCGPR